MLRPKLAVNNAYQTDGQPLAYTPEIFLLRKNDLGRETLKIMNERFGEYRQIKLNPSDLKKDQPIPSNPYRRWALGPIVRELVPDAQLLSPAMSELALREGTLSRMPGYSEELAIVLYGHENKDELAEFSRGRDNDKLMKHLLCQAEDRGMDIEFPMLFYHLKTERDDSFPVGLRLDLDDIAVGFHAPILVRENDAKRYFSANDPELVKTGLPSETGYVGDRELWSGTNESSYLATFSRDPSNNLWAIHLDLSHSHPWHDAGQIHFVKGMIPSNLDEAIASINEEKLKQEKAIEARHAKALEIMG